MCGCENNTEGVAWNEFA